MNTKIDKQKNKITPNGAYDERRIGDDRASEAHTKHKMRERE